MEFVSASVRHCDALFHGVGFGEARAALTHLLAAKTESSRRVEATALLLRLNIERDETDCMEEMRRMAGEVKAIALPGQLQAALYQLGIVYLLADDADEAESCFSQVEGGHGAYGIAAVLHKRRNSEAAVLRLREAREKEELSPDLECLMWILEGNCLKGLSRIDESMAAYLEAQKLLPVVKTFYLKHWVFFGLATAHARKGEQAKAATILEVLLSITHPTDFKRLHRLASDELARLSSEAEVLFDPLTGDIVCGTGYLSLRRKPTLIQLLTVLMRAIPDSVSKERIYQQVWHGEYHPLRHDGLIYSHMQRLRQFLGVDEKLKDFILTTADGYRLNPDLRVTLKEQSHESLHPTGRDSVRIASVRR